MGTAENDEAQGARDGSPGAAELSERQYACLIRAGEGMSSKEIGRVLGISPSTVDNHIHVAITKLNARNRWHAAQLLRPIRREEEPPVRALAPLVPPIGGRPNTAPPRRRLTQIMAIAATSLIALTSACVLILGAIEVFGGN